MFINVLFQHVVVFLQLIVSVVTSRCGFTNNDFGLPVLIPQKLDHPFELGKHFLSTLRVQIVKTDADDHVIDLSRCLVLIYDILSFI